jgi:hypothetical protein
MMHLSELDVRTIEHTLRVGPINQYGWLQPSAHRENRIVRLASASRAVAARLVPKRIGGYVDLNPVTVPSGEDGARSAA